LIEKECMANLIRKRVAKNLKNGKLALSTGDWRKIAAKQNARFVGTEVKIGELMATGKIAKSNSPIDKRSAVAIRTMFDKLSDLVHMINNLVGEVREPEDDASIGTSSVEEPDGYIDDDDADEEEDEESDEEDMDGDNGVGVPGGEMDSLLPESSDDEMDSQLPPD